MYTYFVQQSMPKNKIAGLVGLSSYERKNNIEPKRQRSKGEYCREETRRKECWHKSSRKEESTPLQCHSRLFIYSSNALLLSHSLRGRRITTVNLRYQHVQDYCNDIPRKLKLLRGLLISPPGFKKNSRLLLLKYKHYYSKYLI